MSAYPTVPEAVERVRVAGIPSPSYTQVETALQAAIRALERETGFTPFLAESVATQWHFRPDGSGMIDFAADGGPGGFVEIQEVRHGVIHASPTGLALVAGRDYTLYPVNAALRGRAYWFLRSTLLHFEDFEPSVRVTGRAGGVTAIPEDVYEAICAEVVARVVYPAQAPVAGVSMVRQGDVEVRYGATASGEGDVIPRYALSEQLRAVARSYRRLRIA
ncbi:MAG: hypothetical protein RMJ43_03275 [Chloroherpetonaceae bacterium]|nr:hypothetical protein [Chloroherpetonaceae bacterium]